MKRAIIFGATGGIGEAICQRLAHEGWSLYIHFSSHEDKAQRLCRSLAEQFDQQDFLPLKLDFSDSDGDLKTWAAQILPINAVIFAQGVTDYHFLGDQTLEMIDRIIRINLTVPIKLVRLFEQTLLKQEHARIVFLGSVYGAQGSPLESIYSMTKGALSRFAQSYAREVASTGMTVNVIAPGAVETKMNQIFSKETLLNVKEEIPASRFAKPVDISYWVKAVLDPQADYLTGQTIYIDGGWLV